MIALPWQDGVNHDDEVDLALVSVLHLRHRRDVPAFLKAALELRQTFAAAPGGIALGLAAAPWNKTFWTYSLWTSRAAMGTYTAGPLHRQVMKQFEGRMASSSFQAWSPPGDRASWTEVRRRLAAPGPVIPQAHA